MLQRIVDFVFPRNPHPRRNKPEHLATIALTCSALWDIVITCLQFRALPKPLKRRALLVAKLQEYGLILRADSRV